MVLFELSTRHSGLWAVARAAPSGGASSLALDYGDLRPSGMSQKLVELEEILRTLGDRGPLSNDALARVLDLHSFDLRLALIDAATWGLIGRDRRGAWSLADRGVALVAPSVPVADLSDSVIGRVKRGLRPGFRRAPRS